MGDTLSFAGLFPELPDSQRKWTAPKGIHQSDCTVCWWPYYATIHTTTRDACSACQIVFEAHGWHHKAQPRYVDSNGVVKKGDEDP